MRASRERERAVSPSAGWARRLAAFSAVLLLTAGIGHRYGLVETVAFYWLVGIVGALAVAALLAAGAAFSRLWNHGESTGRDVTVATLVALLVLAPFVVAGARMVLYPQLVDISTDTIDPPAFTVAPMLRHDAMNPIVPIGDEAAALQAESYPEVTGRRFVAGRAQVLGAVRNLVAARGWRVLAGEEPPADWSELTIEAVADTFLLRFPSDVAIRIIDEDESTYVDMRSASRYGVHDLGDNAARIERFLADLETEVAGMAPVEELDPDPEEEAE